MTEELEKIDEMLERIYLNTLHNPWYTSGQDILDLWDYVRTCLGKPKIDRFIEVE